MLTCDWLKQPLHAEMNKSCWFLFHSTWTVGDYFCSSYCLIRSSSFSIFFSLAACVQCDGGIMIIIHSCVCRMDGQV